MSEKPRRPSIPASADPARDRSGRWVPGKSGNPEGRPKGLPNFRTLFASLPDDERGRREAVAKTLGCPLKDVPTGLDRLGLLLWMREQQAYRGHEAALADVFDRALPKPRRHELSGPGGGPVALARSPLGTAGVDADEAAEYYAMRDALPAGDDE